MNGNPITTEEYAACVQDLVEDVVTQAKMLSVKNVRIAELEEQIKFFEHWLEVEYNATLKTDLRMNEWDKYDLGVHETLWRILYQARRLNVKHLGKETEAENEG